MERRKKRLRSRIWNFRPRSRLELFLYENDDDVNPRIIRIGNAFDEDLKTLEEKLQYVLADTDFEEKFVTISASISNFQVQKTIYDTQDHALELIAKIGRASYRMLPSQTSTQVTCNFRKDAYLSTSDYIPVIGKKITSLRLFRFFAFSSYYETKNLFYNFVSSFARRQRPLVKMCMMLKKAKWERDAWYWIDEMRDDGYDQKILYIISSALSAIPMESGNPGNVVNDTLKFMSTNSFTKDMKEALDSYVGIGHEAINSDEKDDKTQRYIKALDAMFTQPNTPRIDKENAFVWRGVNGTQTYLTEVVGETDNTKARFTSTSYEEPPEAFLGKTCCLMRILLPVGFPCISAEPKLDEEHEIILPRNVPMTFLAKEFRILSNGNVIETFLYQAHPIK